MKKELIKWIAFLLALLMTASLIACDLFTPGTSDEEDDPSDESVDQKDEEDGENNDTTDQDDPADDGVFNAKDYDPTKNYDIDKYSELVITDYITLGKYKNLKLSINEESYLITDELLTNRINSILSEHHPDAKIIDRVVAWKDTVVVDYVGKLDGVAFESGTAKEQTIAVEEKNSYIEGFVEGLVGVTPGVPTDVAVTFPESYPNSPDLAGKEVIFTFTVHYIIGNPQLTDEFVADYTEGEITTVEEFETDLRADMQQQAYDASVRMAFWSKVTENAAAKKYPESSVMYYYSYYYQMYSYYASMYGLNIDTYLQLMGSSVDALFEACCKIVKGDMTYYAVFAAEGYECTEEQYQKALETYTETNFDELNRLMEQAGKEPYDYEGAKQYFDENEHDLLMLQALEEIAYNDLITTCTIEVIPAESDDAETEEQQ